MVLQKRIILVTAVFFFGLTAAFFSVDSLYAQTVTPSSTPTPTSTPTSTVTATVTATPTPYYVPISYTAFYSLNTSAQNFIDDDRCSWRTKDNFSNPAITGSWLRCTPNTVGGNYGDITFSYAELINDVLSGTYTNQIFYVTSISFDTDWYQTGSDLAKYIGFELMYDDGSVDSRVVSSGQIGSFVTLNFSGTLPVATSAGGFSSTFHWVYYSGGSTSSRAMGMDNITISGFYLEEGILPTPTPTSTPTITPTATITSPVGTPTPIPFGTVVFDPGTFVPVGGEDDAPLGVINPIDRGETCYTFGPYTWAFSSSSEVWGFELCLREWEYELGLLGWNFSTETLVYASLVFVVVAWIRTR